MTSQETPRTATWFLRRFGCSTDIESVIGDLAERYGGGGRSRLWYWRQVLSSVVALAVKDFLAHRMLALRALLVGWLINGLMYVLILRMIGTFFTPDRALRLMGTPLTLSDYDHEWKLFVTANMLVLLVVSSLLAALSGWLIARLHSPIGKAAVLFHASFYGSVTFVVFARAYVSRIIPWFARCQGVAACQFAPLTEAWGSALIWITSILLILYGGGVIRPSISDRGVLGFAHKVARRVFPS